MRHSMPRLIASTALLLALAVPAVSQVQAPSVADKSTSKPACVAPAGMAEPATRDTAQTDATAPENSGSTGWSGGLGGSAIGTNPAGATRHTKTWHAPTARGLDLSGRPEPVANC